jgi:hypothetical protein
MIRCIAARYVKYVKQFIARMTFDVRPHANDYRSILRNSLSIFDTSEHGLYYGILIARSGPLWRLITPSMSSLRNDVLVLLL